MGKIASKGQDILVRQYKGRERSREAVKERSTTHARYDTISSHASLKQHSSQWNAFGKYMEKYYPEVKGLKKIESSHVEKFIKHEKELGLAEKTLKSRVTAINHVMVGSGVWQPNQAISLKQMRQKGSVSPQKGPQSVYKDLTAKEWREANKGLYGANKDVIDVSRSFGLRRSEIFGKTGSSYGGLTFKNLGYVSGSDRLFAEVIGKGGKYRVAEVRADMQKEMWEKYGKQAREYPKDYFKKSVQEREKLLKNNARRSGRIFGVENRNIPLHINRNEYVEEKLKERQAFWENKKSVGSLETRLFSGKSSRVGYSRIRFTQNNGFYMIRGTNGAVVQPFSVVKIGTWEGYAISACEVMENVGHNRLDVLGKYL